MNALPDQPNELLPFLIADEDHFETLDKLAVTDDALLRLARGAVAHDLGWKVACVGIWTSVRRLGQVTPRQGWKLHLSATSVTAETVLKRVLLVLISHDTAFKFASSPAIVRVLNHPHWPRGSSGKFITVYPKDEQAFVALAEACHQATRELNGPRILSDRQYRPDGIVYYRYGAFSQQTKVDESGFAIQVIQDPDGNPYPDRRNAWFTLPPWVTDPLYAPPKSQQAHRKPRLLNDRYEVEQVLRHTNRGGVYRAVDGATGENVVLKEARPHVATDDLGRDAVYRLEKERHLLDKLAHTGLVPAVVELFWQGGHAFLAQELIHGRSLRDHIAYAFAASRSGLPADARTRLATELARALAAVHEEGVIVRDFTPNNIIIDRDYRVRLIDLELAYDSLEELPVSGGTPAYASSNQLANNTPHPHDDYFSLVVTMSGIGLFLHRCRSGDPRPYMPDNLLAKQQPQKQASGDEIAA
jgi:hypothetical protein